MHCKDSAQIVSEEKKTRRTVNLFLLTERPHGSVGLSVATGFVLHESSSPVPPQCFYENG